MTVGSKYWKVFTHMCTHTRCIWIRSDLTQTHSFSCQGSWKTKIQHFQFQRCFLRALESPAKQLIAYLNLEIDLFFKIFSVSSHWKSFLSMGLSVTETMISCYRLFATSSSERNSL